MPASVRHPRWKAPLLLVLATAFWSISFPTMKAITLAQQAALPDVSTWFSAALCMTYRFGIAALLMLIWCAPTLRRLTRLEISEGVGLGLFASVGLVLQMDGLAYTSASTSAFLTQLYCLIIPLWLALLHRRFPSPTILIACVLVTIGVGVLSEVDWHTLRLGRGEIETLLASVVFTGQILWLQRPKFAANNVSHFTFVMFAVIALACLPLAVATAQRPSDLLRAYASVPLWIFQGILIVFCTLSAFTLMNSWQPRVTATQAGLIYCAEPVFASLLALAMPAWLSQLAHIHYPNETLRTSLLVGGGLITLANILVQLQPSAPHEAPPAPVPTHPDPAKPEPDSPPAPPTP